MVILGICDSHDASVVVIDGGQVRCAVSEERFTRRKRQQGFPWKSLEYVKHIIGPRHIDKVVVVGKYGRAVFRIFNTLYSRGNPSKNILSFSSRIARWLENTIATLPVIRDCESFISLLCLRRRLRALRLPFTSLELIDHHTAHVITALTGFHSDHYLAVSLDAYGDGKAGILMYVRHNQVVKSVTISYKHSIAHVFGVLSSYLGFEEGNEGKLMALADYGKHTDLVHYFRSLFCVKNGEVTVDGVYQTEKFRRRIAQYNKEDIAFAIENVIEEVTLALITDQVLSEDKPDLFLAGGLFANIKINKRLYESGRFHRIYVFPAMGDGGTCFAAAGYDNAIPYAPDVYLSSVYLGPQYYADDITDSLKAQELDYVETAEIEKEIALCLTQSKTVARFNGSMEYGPRALGNRSILYQTIDHSAQAKLNKVLGREEFMPFAPVTLYEYRELCYHNSEKIERAAEFMTMALSCTAWMKQNSAGVVHVDGTARPQYVRRENNPSLYKILKEYHALSGNPSLLNTSFNRHGEPIVCSPADAIKTFKNSSIDYLAIGKFLAKRKE